MSNFKSKIKSTIVSFLLLVFLFFQNGCVMDGVKHLTVIDENKNQLKRILIVPLYSKSFGIGVGPEGKGLHSKAQLIVTKPFIFNSGDDLMNQKISTKGISLLFVFIGSSNYVDNWLFMKKGYIPKLVQRADIYGESPIILTKAINDENSKLIDVLLSPTVDQHFIKKLFGVEWRKDEIAVIFDENDIGLLKTYRLTDDKDDGKGDRL